VCRSLTADKFSTLDLLTALTDKSIISAGETKTEMRYFILETLRQFAAEKRLQRDEDETIRAAHFEYFLELAERTGNEVSQPDKQITSELLTNEIDNLRLALEYGAAENPPAFLRFCNALWQFWQSSGRLEEGRRNFENALAKNGDAPAESRVKTLQRLGGLMVLQCDYAGAARIYEDGLRLARDSKNKFYEARILANYGFTLVNLNEFVRAETLLGEGLEIFHRLKDEKGIAQILNGLGSLAFYRNDFGAASAFYAESLETYRRIEHQLNIIGLLQNLGTTEHLRRNLDEAENYLREAIQIAEKLGERRWLNQTRHVLGYVCNDKKDYAQALKFFTEALTLDEEIGGKNNAAHVFEGISCAAAARKDYFRALKLASVADHLREEIKVPRGETLQKYFESYWNSARQAVNPEDAARAVAEARAMSFDEAIEYALHSG
ncbi:MAG: tetratricopeptide repeat protein, partial [Actinomycetota bacterium]